MRARVATLLFCGLVGCAMNERPVEPARPVPTIGPSTRGDLLWPLVDSSTPEEIRASLRKGLDQRDLAYCGFDQVTLADSIERVVEAAIAHRKAPGDPRRSKALADAVDLYLSVRREAWVHRHAGTDSCIPAIR